MHTNLTEDGVPLTGKYVFNDGDERNLTELLTLKYKEGTTSFLPVKGILNSHGGNVTMRISGDYYSVTTTVHYAPININQPKMYRILSHG